MIPGSERSPGEGNGYPLQYSCLENSMDRERSLAGYSPWDHLESDTTERLRPFMSSLEKCLFRSSACFFVWIGCFVFLCFFFFLSCMNSLYILEIKTLSVR